MKRLLCNGAGMASVGVLVFFFGLPNVAFRDDAGQQGGTGHHGIAIAVTGLAIMFLVEVLRSPLLGRLVERIPRRWRIALPVVLSGVASILWNIRGGAPWPDAVYIGLFAGPTAVFAHEAVVEALLGHSRAREERASMAQVPVTGPFTSHRAP